MKKEIELPKIPERQIKKHLYLPESMDDITTDALEAMGYVQFAQVCTLKLTTMEKVRWH